MTRRNATARAPAGPDPGIPLAYHDLQFNLPGVKILPGQYHIATSDTVLMTVLGSCVSACIRDPLLGIGGMNHFMLPECGVDGVDGVSARYGAFAMETLVNELLKLGARRERMEAKVFGGGSVMAGMTQSRIGERNAAFVLRFLEDEQIGVAASDLLGTHPRKVCYFPVSGRALVKRLNNQYSERLLCHEEAYRTRMSTLADPAPIELFE